MYVLCGEGGQVLGPYASINVKPKGEGWAHLGNLTSIDFPILRNLTKNLGPRVGMFALHMEEWDQGT